LYLQAVWSLLDGRVKRTPGAKPPPGRQLYNASVRAQSEPQPAAPPADRLEFETLISDVSAALMAISPEQVESAIDDALEKLRDFFRADRCAVLTVSDDQQVVNVVQASYASGVSYVSGDIEPGELFPWTRGKVLVERIPVTDCLVHDRTARPAHRCCRSVSRTDPSLAQRHAQPAIRGVCQAAHTASDVDDQNVVWYFEKWEAVDHFERHLQSKTFDRLLSVVETAATAPVIECRLIAETQGLEYLAAVRASQ
jgi:hypothetical protein